MNQSGQNLGAHVVSRLVDYNTGIEKGGWGKGDIVLLERIIFTVNGSIIK